MALVEEQVPAGLDDASAALDVGGHWDVTGPSLYLGDRGSNNYHTWTRFTSVAVPAGATIESAYMSYRARYADTTTVCNLRFRGQDEDDAAQLADRAAYDAVNWTSATVDWDALGSWVIAEWYQGPDIKAIIQEIVDRPGWATGQAMGIDCGNNNSTNTADRRAMPYENAPGNAPKLVIVYTEGGVVYDETGHGTVVLVVTGVTDLQAYIHAIGTLVLAVTGLTDIRLYLDNVGTIVLVVVGVVDLQGYVHTVGTVVLVVMGISEFAIYNPEDLGTVVLVVIRVVDTLPSDTGYRPLTHVSTPASPLSKTTVPAPSLSKTTSVADIYRTEPKP